MIKNNKVQFILVAIIIGLGIYVVLSSNSLEYSPDFIDDYYTLPNKYVGINEYQVVSINNDDIIKMYFNSFISMVMEEPVRSYAYINEDYRNLKFKDYNDYKQYIDRITQNGMVMPEVKSYKIVRGTGNKIYSVIDTNGNQYFFYVEAVMKYSVYFDEDTIKIE